MMKKEKKKKTANWVDSFSLLQACMNFHFEVRTYLVQFRKLAQVLAEGSRSMPPEVDVQFHRILCLPQP